MLESVKPALSRRVFELGGHIVATAVFAILGRKIESLTFPTIVLICFVYLAVMTAAAIVLERRQRERQRLAAEQERRVGILWSGVLKMVTKRLNFAVSNNYECCKTLEEAGRRPPAERMQLIQSALAVLMQDHRTVMNEILEEACNVFKMDTYGRPAEDPSGGLGNFKATYYAVEKKDDGSEVLKKAYRAYPQDRWPQTQEFRKGEEGGGAGLAWQERRIQIFQECRKDKRWRDFRPGHSTDYESMVCMPVILDVPKLAFSQVQGVLTIDTLDRKGYFVNGGAWEVFWGDLLHPITAMMCYVSETNKRQNLLASLLSSGR
jgi:hypothetical protein